MVGFGVLTAASVVYLAGAEALGAALGLLVAALALFVVPFEGQAIADRTLLEFVVALLIAFLFGVFGLVEMGLFILTVFAAYAYVWRRGGLDWN